MPDFVKTFRALRTLALRYPETREDLPWGESAIKVKGKTFVFMRADKTSLSLSVKLPVRGQFALEYPFAKPTPYGLGKSGWVSFNFSGKDKPPMDMLTAWIDESFRAIAPKKIVATLDEPESSRGPKISTQRHREGRRSPRK
jgi:predicted DNA-binding protein (MmcQ/YjbR family)